jgi:hypothetical protein
MPILILTPTWALAAMGAASAKPAPSAKAKKLGRKFMAKVEKQME